MTLQRSLTKFQKSMIFMIFFYGVLLFSCKSPVKNDDPRPVPVINDMGAYPQPAPSCNCERDCPAPRPSSVEHLNKDNVASCSETNSKDCKQTEDHSKACDCEKDCPTDHGTKNCTKLIQNKTFEMMENDHLKVAACLDYANQVQCEASRSFIVECLTKFGKKAEDTEERIDEICKNIKDEPLFCKKE